EGGKDPASREAVEACPLPRNQNGVATRQDHHAGAELESPRAAGRDGEPDHGVWRRSRDTVRQPQRVESEILERIHDLRERLGIERRPRAQPEPDANLHEDAPEMVVPNPFRIALPRAVDNANSAVTGVASNASAAHMRALKSVKSRAAMPSGVEATSIGIVTGDSAAAQATPSRSPLRIRPIAKRPNGLAAASTDSGGSRPCRTSRHTYVENTMHVTNGSMNSVATVSTMRLGLPIAGTAQSGTCRPSCTISHATETPMMRFTPPLMRTAFT